MYRFFSREHSYFSGEARAHLRWKQHHGAGGPTGGVEAPDAMLSFVFGNRLRSQQGLGPRRALATGEHAAVALAPRVEGRSREES